MAQRVWSKHRLEEVPAGAVYVGRPGPFGNPFPVYQHTQAAHAACVARYEAWLWAPAQQPLRARMWRELRGHDLVCWCAPLPCHAHAIVRALQRMEHQLWEAEQLAADNGVHAEQM